MGATKVDYARSAFDLIEEFDRLTTTEQVMGRLASAMSAFGYSAFLITGVPQPPLRVEPYFLLNGWPPDFTEHYSKEDYYLDDPVAAWCRKSIDPYDWSEARYDPDAWPRAAEVMNLAADFGMRVGYCVPIIRGNGLHECVTMAGERPDFDPRAKRAMHIVSMFAHKKAVDLLGIDKEPYREGSTLTDREREVLLWSAAGKSSWEISRIVGLSERTVNWTMGNAMKKLEAVTRTQAVVNAIRTGQIRI